VGRSDTDRAKALDYLQRAAQGDQRNVYPFTHRELGLMQARLGQTPAAAASLKQYVANYVAKHYVHPPDLEEVYDYLLTFGDRTWTAPAVDPSVIRARYVPPGPATPAVTDETAAPLLPKTGTAPARKPAAKPSTKKPAGGGPVVTKPGGGGQ
jgi:hypothetical protein